MSPNTALERRRAGSLDDSQDDSCASSFVLVFFVFRRSVLSAQRFAFTSGRVMKALAAVWCNAGLGGSVEEDSPQSTNDVILTCRPVQRDAISQAGAVLEDLVPRDAVPHWQDYIPAFDKLASEYRIELRLCPTAIPKKVGCHNENALRRFPKPALN